MDLNATIIYTFVALSFVVAALGFLTYLNFERYRFKGDNTTLFFVLLTVLFLASFITTLSLVPPADPNSSQVDTIFH